MKVFMPIKTARGLNNREHWGARQRRVKRERTDAYTLTAGWRIPDGQAGMVRLTRYYPAKPLDTDNLAGALKSVRDGIADRLGIDDGDARIVWDYQQQKCKRGEFGVIAELIL